MDAAIEPPFLVALNLTRRCNLQCGHCYLDAGARAQSSGELTTDEVKGVFDGIASLGGETMVVLTGGEPLLRQDAVELVRHASGLGLMAVMGSNGLLLDGKMALALKESGAMGVGISLDSLDPAFHDRFRGQPGSFVKAMDAIGACRGAGLGFQIHFSVMDGNASELDDMIAFARTSGALVLNVFFLVCTGRGEKMTGIASETYDKVLRKVTKAAHDEEGLIVRAKCAPYFKRMAIELDPSWPVTLAHGYEAGGCMAGTRYCRITPEGMVTPCPYMENPAGSIREKSFAGIWRDAPLFKALRAPVLSGRCGLCEYRKICGGCRARPAARFGDIMGEDFLCDYQPKGGAVIEPLPSRGEAVSWSAAASERLDKVPSFLRRMVKSRVENFVREQGRDIVAAEDMRRLARKRFGGHAPFFPAALKMPEKIGED